MSSKHLPFVTQDDNSGHSYSEVQRHIGSTTSIFKASPAARALTVEALRQCCKR